MVVNIHEAKTNLSKLLLKMSSGEEIIIAKNNIPIAKIIPYKNKEKKRLPGKGKNLIEITGDLTEPLPYDIIQEFFK